MKSFRILDAFAGIGGFRLGAQRAASTLGIPVKFVAAIEWNPDSQKTYLENFGEAPLGDITKIDPMNLPDHDILTGGFPCQPFSKNGRFYNKNDRTLGDDDRANLFLSLVGILEAKKPRYFIFENVKGLLSMNNADGTPVVDTILENLSGCGYKTVHKVLDSADFGLPQQRNRVFFVGIREDIEKSFEFPLGSQTDTAVEDILEKEAPPKCFLKTRWKNRTLISSDKDGRPGKRVANHPFLKGSSRYEAVKWLYDNAQKPKSRTGKIESVAVLYGDTPSGWPRQQDKIYSVKGISPTIATFSTPAFDTPEGMRILTVRECLRLQGFPESFKITDKEVTAYEQIGNAVSVNVVEALFLNLLK